METPYIVSNYNKIRKILNDRFKLVVLHEDTFEEKASFTGKLWYWMTAFVSIGAIVIILTIVLIRVTSLREYVIGTALSPAQRVELNKTYERLDSLEQLAHANELYLDNLQRVLRGEVGETMDEVANQPSTTESPTPSTEVTGPSEDELALRELVESGAPYDIAENQQNRTSGIASYTFYRPVNGVVSSTFSLQEEHYAIDVAVKMNEPVRSTLSGHVIFASYTPETGYVVIIQHNNNLLSIYKHCSSILKKVGNFVRAGEVIAFAGNTGELSTGPHLHFELWHNGTPVDPTTYISF